MINVTELNINFMGHRKLALAFSTIVLLISIGAIAINGLNLALDFTGGTQMEVGYQEPADLNQVREVLAEQGLDDAVVVHFGSNTEVLIRFQGSLEDVAVNTLNERLQEMTGSGTAPQVTGVERMSDQYQTKVLVSQGDLDLNAAKNELFPAADFGQVDMRREGEATAFLLGSNLTSLATETLVEALSAAAGSPVTMVRNEFVGTQVGDDMLDNAVIGALTALALVMIYVAFRFQYKFAIGAVAALFHDVLFVLGWFALFKIEFDLTVFAAVLAVIGYSLNDTIVIADRIRENMRTLRKKTPFEIINISINQTLGRTFMTSFSTLLVLLALFFVGGDLIHGFSLALIIGIVVGTFSTVYVASALLLIMNIQREDMLTPVKEGAELDSLP